MDIFCAFEEQVLSCISLKAIICFHTELAFSHSSTDITGLTLNNSFVNILFLPFSNSYCFSILCMEEGCILILHFCFFYFLPVFFTMVSSRFPFVLSLYLTLLAVISDYRMIPFSILEAAMYMQYLYIWAPWRLTDCVDHLVGFTFLIGIVTAARELTDTGSLEALKPRFSMTLPCLTFLLRYDYNILFACVLKDQYLAA